MYITLFNTFAYPICSATGPRPKHAARAVRSGRGPDNAGPGHTRAQLHHHSRGVQAQQAAPL